MILEKYFSPVMKIYRNYFIALPTVEPWVTVSLSAAFWPQFWM